MKNIIKIEDVEYIKKSKYDQLEKKKVKIIKEKSDGILNNCVTNPENTMALISLNKVVRRIYEIDLPDKLGTYKEIEQNKMEFLEPKIYNNDEENTIPRIKLGNNIYSYNYFEQAKRIADSLNVSPEFKLLIKKDDSNTPLLMDFYTFGILIAPRMESDD